MRSHIHRFFVKGLIQNQSSSQNILGKEKLKSIYVKHIIR